MTRIEFASLIAGPWDVQTAVEQLGAMFDGDPRREMERALRYASRLHAGQRRADGLPYIVHPIRVGIIVANDGELDSTMRLMATVAGLLHDTLEDTDATHGEISRLFGSETSRIVSSLTTLAPKRGETIEERHLRKTEKWSRLQSADLETLVVHAADVCDNTVSLRNLVPGCEGWAKLPRWLFQVMEYQIPLLEYRLPEYVEFLRSEIAFERSRGVGIGDWTMD